MPLILDENKQPIALVTDDRENIDPDEETQGGLLLLDWLDGGVPALVGVQDSDSITEKEVTRQPDDPLFMLSLLEEIERRGWAIDEDGDAANEFSEEQHPRDQFGKFTTGERAAKLAEAKKELEPGGYDAYKWRKPEPVPGVTSFSGHRRVDGAKLNGVKFEPWSDHPKSIEEWAKVEGQNHNFKEPPLPAQTNISRSLFSSLGVDESFGPVAKRQASGCIIKEPDGRVWVVEPANHFPSGQLWHTFPKGGIEHGLNPQANAIKEAFEETGLKVAITGYAGDFDRGTSSNRYYFAKRVGGTPSDHGLETQRVKLVTPKALKQILTHHVDQKIADIANEFREEEHPRASDGKFTSGSGEGRLEGVAKLMQSKVQDISGWTKKKDKLGTNPGGVYENPDGDKFYVKFPKDEDHLKNEQLALKLYALAGAPVPENMLVVDGGKTGIATKWVDGDKYDPTDKESLDAVRSNFAAHAWLANWDAIGAGSENPKDNQQIVGDKAYTIDAGGAMLFGGLGAEKPFTPEVGEWTSLRDPSVNPTCAEAFADISKKQLLESAQAVANINPHDISKLANQFGPGSDTDKGILAGKLMLRRKDIIEKAQKIDGLPVTDPHAFGGKTPSGTGITPVEMPGWAGKFPKGHSSYNLSQAVMAIAAAAKSGDIEAVKAVKLNPHSSLGYAKTAWKYKQDTLAKMGHAKEDPGEAPQKKSKIADVKISEPEPPKTFSVLAPKQAWVYTPGKQAAPYAAKMLAMYEMAKSGDIEGVKNTPISETSKLGYSQYALAYKNALITSLLSQGATGSGNAQPLPQPLMTKAAKATTTKMSPKEVDNAVGFPTWATQNKAHLEENTAWAKEAQALAHANDIKGLEELKKSPSQVCENYRSQLIMALKEHYKPKVPAPEMSGTIAFVDSHVHIVPQEKIAEHSPKIAKFCVLAKVGVPKAEDMPHATPLTQATRDQHSEHLSKAPSEVRKLIREYTTGAYHEINNALRNGTADKHVMDVARAFNQAAIELPTGTQYTRNLSISSKFTEANVVKLGSSLGAVIQEPGVSSSGKFGTGGKVKMHITSLPGARAIYVDKHSANQGEDEMCYPPNQRYIITGYMKDKNGVHHLNVLALSTPKDQVT